MRGLVKKVAIVVLASAVVAGTAYAVTGELDPASVPQGFFALGNRATDTFKLKVGSGPEHVYRDGAEVTAQHIQIPAGASSGWHLHGGPVFVQVVSGTLTLYERDDPTCTPHVVSVGQGYVDTGAGHIGFNATNAAAQDVTVPIAPVGAAFRTELDAPGPHCNF